MSLSQLIQTAREKAGKLVVDSRALGVKIRETQERKEATGELETQFEAMMKDTTDSLRELNRLEAEQSLEESHTRLTAPPTEVFTGRRAQEGLTVHTPNLNRQQRRERREFEAQRLMFARAGVTDIPSFQRFRDAHTDAFEAFTRHGNSGAMAVLESQGFKPSESMALLSTSGELGGFLVPDDFRAEVLKDLAGFAVIRRLARVERTGSSTLVFPSIQPATTDADIYSSGYQGAWQPEGYVTGGTTPTVQNQPKFGQSRVPVHVWAPNAVELSQELLADSAANLDSIMAEVIAEVLAMDEDSAFINGNGAGKPLGLLTTASGHALTEVNSGHATLLTYGGLVDLFVNLPAQYRQNAKWLMNSLSLGAIMKLADTAGMPLFPVNQVPTQLFGKTMEFSEFMPDIAASANPIVFGDFRHYGIADRQELRVQRLVEKFAPNIGMLPTARVGGQTLRPAAFRKQKVSA